MVNPYLIEVFNYSSRLMSLLLVLTLLIFVPLLVWKLMKISKITFTHSEKSRLKRIPYFTNLYKLKFTPSTFLPLGHMQTCILPFLTFKENGRKHLWNFKYEREIFELSDGGQIALDWAIPRDPKIASKIEQDDSPILAIVPGLTGHNDDLYMVSTSQAAVENGYKLVLINHRGCSNSILTTPQFYSAGMTIDLEQAVNYLNELFPKRDIYILGFSIGANILANYLAKMGKRAPVKTALWVGNPYDLIKVSDEIVNKLFGLYNKVFTMNLVRKYHQHIEMLRPLEEKLGIRLETALQDMRSVRELDGLITWRQYGFDSVEEYYSSCSSSQNLKDIRIPTMFLNALDDPIFDKIAIPYEEFEKNDNIMLATTTSGGHIGFLEGSIDIKQWFTKPIFEYLSYFRNEER